MAKGKSQSRKGSVGDPLTVLGCQQEAAFSGQGQMAQTQGKGQRRLGAS